MKKIGVTPILLLILCSLLVSLPEINLAAAEPERWQQTYGGTDDDGALSLIQTSDGGYALVGYTRSYGAGGDDFWLVRIDGSGNMQWNQTYGGAGSDIASSLIETSDGGYAIAGYTYAIGSENSDLWLIKTDEAGIIPEFPSLLLAIPLLAALMLILVLIRRRLPRNVFELKTTIS